MKIQWKRILLISVSYILVAAVASACTLFLWDAKNNKLAELENIIENKFIGDADMEEARDAAAAAMVDAIGDRWSYYISAEDYAAHLENKNNAFVGVGITISRQEEGNGYDILEVSPGGSAQEGGILPGDLLIEVEGQSTSEMTMEEVKRVVRGEIGAEVTLTVLRGEELLSFTLERREIRVEVAKGQMLSGNVGYVKIANFNTNCADETIEAVEALLEQGAQGLIFDVRNNPGGYVDEMLEVLDYLLPKGVLYRDLDYLGNEGEERSDASCLELPMAVLVNEDSYSAAEFFAAAMQEFEWATIVGQHTTGKGHYQNTLRLSDGSAVNLSTGKYFTPSGKNLTETGGIAPDIVEEVDEETASLIYSEALEPEKDPQIQAALSAVMGMVE